jgi:hypothetical protein
MAVAGTEPEPVGGSVQRCKIRASGRVSGDVFIMLEGGPTLGIALTALAACNALVGVRGQSACDALETLSTFIAECSPAASEWHESVYISRSEGGGSSTDEVCTVLAQTDGTCAAWCGSHGMRCVRGQNNVASGGCELDGRHAGGAGSGCYAPWVDQVCACAAPPPPSPPPVCRADICGDIANDCCAPDGEDRVCKDGAYFVASGGTTSYGPCIGRFGQTAVYQCCPLTLSAPPSALQRRGRRGSALCGTRAAAAL